MSVARTLSVVLFLLAALFSVGRAQEALKGFENKELKPLRFSQGSPLATRAAILKRVPVLGDPRGSARVVDLAKEGFHIYEGRKRARYRGAVVWISPMDAPWLDPTWEPALKRSGLLFVTPDRGGNERPVLHRAALALEAAHGLQQKYRLDTKRIFIAGFSGGGRCSSWMALHWPEVFRGAFCMGGTDWFEDATSKKVGQTWKGRIPAPKPEAQKVLKRHPLVWMAGTECFNRAETAAIYRKAKSGGFQRVLHLEEKGLAHLPASGKAFAKGLAFLMRHAR